MGCLYKLTSPSGKAYVGITLQDFAARLALHLSRARRGYKYPLAAAIRKYGEDAFLMEVLGRSDNPKVLLIWERKAVEAFKCISPNGYNACAGGVANMIVSEDFRKKARNHLAEQRKDPDFVARRNAATARRMKALWANPEYRKSQLSILHSRESRKKAAHGQKAAWASNPNRKTCKGYRHTPEHNAKIGAANKIALVRPETRSRIIEQTKSHWRDPVSRSKRISAMRAAKAYRRDRVGNHETRQAHQTTTHPQD